MRRTTFIKRTIKPDQKYHSIEIEQLINKTMLSGQKMTARAIVYSALEEAGAKLKTDPLTVFERAIQNIGPALEVRSKRIGGATYQVPVEVRPNRKQALALRWILESARARKSQTMATRLATELMDAYNNTGTAVKRRDTVHKMAEANRAFAHFARM
jgi:small subunit ribosomal protein S7